MPNLDHGTLGWCEFSVTVCIVVTAFVYMRGWLQLRSSPWNVIAAWRAGSFLLGLFLIWIAVASPIAAFDQAMLTIHMVQHLLLMTLAPPLIWLGAPVIPLLQGLPPRFVKTVIRPLFRRTLVRPRGALTQLAFWWLASTLALVAWHIPAAFTLGLQSGVWHFVEHATFLGTGLLFWWPVVQPWPNVSRWPDFSIILYLFLATLPCDILSGFLVFCDRVVYPVYFSASPPFGLSALEDQQCAGALMWTCVTIVYLVAGTILTMRLLAPRSSYDDEFVPSELRNIAMHQSDPVSLEVL